ncbi:MAG: hypothetical protein WDZ46_02770 [Solirubrobacterales bacterium]
MRRLQYATAIVGLGALVFTGSAQACSCVPLRSGEAMQRADAAISGWLLEVVPQNRLLAVYRYRVRRVYKSGNGIRRGQIVSVRGARSAAACGLPRQTGRRYGLLLSWQRGAWTSGLCALLRRQKCAS